MKTKCWDCDNQVEIQERYLKSLRSRGKEPLCDSCKKERKRKESRERARRIRRENQEAVLLPCKYCQSPTETKKYKQAHHERKGGIVCRDCQSKISSEFLTELRDSQSDEERSEQGKKARSEVKNSSEAVSKQWDTIRNDEEKYGEICDRHSRRMKDVWKDYDEQTKEKIISGLVSSIGKSRSQISDSLKQNMDKLEMVGFESEQYFHGFIPDEINHDLKIIVEMFGDLYHCNPRRYKNPDRFLKTINRTVGEQWKRDQRRLACFYRHGYSVIIIWEKDYRTNPEHELRRIQGEINRKTKN